MYHRDDVGTSTDASEEGTNMIQLEEEESPHDKKPVKQPFAIYMLSICATIGGLLFGYDTGIINGALLVLEDDFDLTSFWKESIVTATVAAAALFSILSGVIADKLGRKPTIMLAALIFASGGVIMGISPNLVILFIGRFTVGAGIGIVSCIVPIYVSECAPKEIRGRLITLNQVFITLGIVLSAILAGVFQSVPNGWRWMLGLAAIPGIVQFILFIFLPESPRYLVIKDRIEESKNVLLRIRSEEEDVNYELEEIKESVMAEKENHGIKIWKAVFQTPHVKKALSIGCALQFFQQFCGINTVIYYSATILKNAGFSDSMAIWLSVIPSGVNFLATFIGLWAVESLGRKLVLAISFLAIGVACAILSIGFILGSNDTPSTFPINDYTGSYGVCADYGECDGCIKSHDETCGYCGLNEGKFRKKGACVKTKVVDKDTYAVAGRCSQNSTVKHKFILMHEYCPNDYAALPLMGLILFVLAFAPGAGPMPWTINAEIYPSWSRSVANSIATFTNWICNVIVSFSFMSMLRALQAYGTFFIFMGVCIVAALFVMIFVPETKGRSLEEIEFLFMDANAKEKFKRKHEEAEQKK